MASKVWLSIRDLFLGQNGTKQDVNRALVLACFCSHPDADWLLRACAKYNVRTLAHARDAFRQEKQDARSLCFAWHLDENRDLSVLKQAVEMGDSFAMATMVNFTTQDAEFAKLARLSAAAGERLGQHFWAVCLLAGIDTEVNEEVGKRVAITAAENGEMNAMVMASDLLDDMDCRKWEWLAAVARTFNPNFFVDCFPRFVGTKDVAIIFLIGKALFGYVNVRRRQIFDQNREFHPFVSSAVEAIKFYEAQLKGAKDAVDAWTIIAIRLKVVKDIRRVIASLIWGARGEAEYR